MSSNNPNKFLRAAQEMNLRVPIHQPEVQSQQFIQQPINPLPVPINNPPIQDYQSYQQNIPPQPPINVYHINEGVTCPPQPLNPPQQLYASYLPQNQVQNPDEDVANMLLDELDQFTKQILSLPYKAEPNPEIRKKFPYPTPTSQTQAERALFTLS